MNVIYIFQCIGIGVRKKQKRQNMYAIIFLISKYRYLNISRTHFLFVLYKEVRFSALIPHNSISHTLQKAI